MAKSIRETYESYANKYLIAFEEYRDLESASYAAERFNERWEKFDDPRFETGPPYAFVKSTLKGFERAVRHEENNSMIFKELIETNGNNPTFSLFFFMDKDTE